MASLQEAAWRVRGRELDDGVQVGALVGGAPDRLGLVDGGDGDDVPAGPQPLDGGPQEGAAVAEVRAEADEGPAARSRDHDGRPQRARRTRTPVEPTSRASGGRTLRTVTSIASSRGSSTSSASARRPASASSSW